MAYDNQASFARIGFFIVAGIALIAGTLVYLGGAGDASRQIRAETFFTDTVSGLEVGSSVTLRGVRVGTVGEISFLGSVYRDLSSPEDRRKIYVELVLDTEKFRDGTERRPAEVLHGLVTNGLHATVTGMGLTGLKHIELNFPKGEVEDAVPGWHPEHELIPPAPSFFDSLEDVGRKVAKKLDGIDFASGCSNVLDCVRNANGLLLNVNSVLSAGESGITETLDNVRAAAVSLREFAERFNNRPLSVLQTPGVLDETR